MFNDVCFCLIVLLTPVLSWADPKQEALTHFDQGMEALGKWDFDRAITCFNEAIRLDPNHVETYLRRAYAFRVKGDMDRAIADNDRAIRLAPDDGLTYFDRAQTYLFKNEYDRSIADFNRAIRIDPKNRPAYYCERGRVYSWHKHDNDRAIADFSRVIQLDPKYFQAYVDRGGAYATKKETDRAIADYTKALQLAAEDPATYDALESASLFQARGAVCAEKKDYDRAIADFSEAIRLAPRGIAYAYSKRGRAYVAKAEFDRAIADFRESIRLLPEYPESYYGLAWVLATCPKAELRNGEKAVKSAKKGLEVSPGWLDQEGFNVLAAAYAEKGDFKEAIANMRKALREPGTLSKEDMQARLRLYEQGKPCRSPSALSDR